MNEYIKKTALLFRKHEVAILFSVLIGFIVVGPQILFIHELGNNYKGIYMTGADAELHYLARMQEVVDSGGLGNPFIYEYKNNVPSTAYTISETILAWPARIFSLSISDLSLFYKFLLPAIIALLAYGLTYRLIGSRLWSVVSMITIVLGSTLLNLPDILHLVRWEEVYTQFVIYSRPINPEFSSILFFIYLHTLLTVLKRRTSDWFILLGLLLGLSFYTYLYSYTFFLALNFVLFCIYLVKKDMRQAFGFFYATVIGLAIGSLSIINTLKLYGHPYFQDMATLSDIIYSHHSIVSIAGIVVAIVFFIFALKHKNYPNIVFLGALLTTSFIVINQQIITGILIQEGHYHWYFNTPIFILILITASYFFTKERYRVVGVIIAVLVGVVSLTSSVLIQTSSYGYWVAKTQSNQKYAEVLAWIKTNTSKESVVLANKLLSELIPVYTSANVVWEDHASYYLLPQERRDFTPDNIMAATDLKKALSKYRVDYLVWDIKSEHGWKLDEHTFLKLVYNNGEFRIYEK